MNAAFRRHVVGFGACVALLQGCAPSHIASSSATMLATPSSDTRSFIVRLKPGQDVKTELEALANANHLQAASIVSVVGSLTNVALRYANQPTTTRLQGHFEVVAMSGYLADGEFHCHLAVSDGEGKTLGGHLMDGNVVYTTLVVVIQEHLQLRYQREFDPKSNYAELVIAPRR
ncbi:MAG TPA: DNA-binding protein [Kofleriaceae bacterium]|nr:DNA-binding protein [Kofleriaceae bacterium]